MTWGNPWAWLGLLTLAVPVLVHMLGRRRAKVLRFPTLRFLELSRLQPVRRTRVQDVALLALRVLILALAVSALAQPLLRTQSRDATQAASLARVVVVDTSASMRRDAAVEGAVDSATVSSAVAVARREAERLVADAAEGLIVETVAPATALSGAAAWLGTRAGPGEIVVLSDFQAGTIDSLDIAAAPTGPAIRLQRMALRVGDPVGMSTLTGSYRTQTTIRLAADATTFKWQVTEVDNQRSSPLLLTAPADSVAARAASHAAHITTVNESFDASRPIAFVFDGYAGRDALWRSARPVASPWMADALRRMASNRLLSDVLRREAAGPTQVAASILPGGGRTVPLGRPGTSPIAYAASAAIDGVENLVFFVQVAAGSMESAALIRAAGGALVHDPSPSELDPAVIADSLLSRLERPPVAVQATASAGSASDARWFWLAVLVLLGVETLVRRASDRSRRTVS